MALVGGLSLFSCCVVQSHGRRWGATNGSAKHCTLDFRDAQRMRDRGMRLATVWRHDSPDQATGRSCTEWVRNETGPAGAGESGINESHHAKLADREGERSRMERKGRVRPCWPQHEPFGRLAAVPWSRADAGRALWLAFCGGGSTIILEEAGERGYPGAKWEMSGRSSPGSCGASTQSSRPTSARRARPERHQRRRPSEWKKPDPTPRAHNNPAKAAQGGSHCRGSPRHPGCDSLLGAREGSEASECSSCFQ